MNVSLSVVKMARHGVQRIIRYQRTTQTRDSGASGIDPRLYGPFRPTSGKGAAASCEVYSFVGLRFDGALKLEKKRF